MPRAKLLPKQVRQTAPETAPQARTGDPAPKQAPKVARPLIRRPAGPESVLPDPWQYLSRKPGDPPRVCVLVQARDGRWLYGTEGCEKKLKSKATGDFDSAAEAREDAAKHADIIINPATPHKVQRKLIRR